MRWMFRWILDDTRALLGDLRQLGRRLTTRWQWLRLRSRRRLDVAAAGLENVRRSAEARTRMCPHCRALIPTDARTCPECSAALAGRSRGLTRVVENMIPGFASVSSVVLTLNMLMYAISLLVWSRLSVELPGDVRDLSWSATLIGLGSNSAVAIAHGEVWRLLTMMFLHGFLLHLVLNCWALLTIGPLVEEIYGPRKLLAMYLLSGVGGSLASLWWNPPSWHGSVGASGAIFGLLGVGVAWSWRRGGRFGASIRGQMIQWVLYGLVMGFLIHGVDNAAHIGGLVTGGLLALVIRDGEPRSAAGSRAWETIAWLCGLVVLGSFVMVGLHYEGTLVALLGSS